jgi:flagellar biosynthesis/type III secretory pathway protein FliH
MRLDAIAGVLYAEDFDAPDEPERLPAPRLPEPEPVPSPPEPSFSFEDLRHAVEQGRMEGRALERREMETTLAARQTALLEQLAQAVAGARQDAARAAERVAEEAARTTLAVLAAALPATCARHGDAEARAVFEALLPGLRGEPRVKVRVHPSLAPDLQATLDLLADDDLPAVTLCASERMVPGDIAVSWQDGSAARDSQAICAAIQAALALDPPPSVAAMPARDHADAE